MKALWVGRGLTVVVALVAWRLWGNAAGYTAACFGLLAATIQYFAAKFAAKVPKEAKFEEFVKGWAAGMGLRTLGVVVLAVVCTVWPARFPALGAAMGYLGVLIPLLFLETRTAR
jgi:F0F1-type ATP synthase assembly protein I